MEGGGRGREGEKCWERRDWMGRGGVDRGREVQVSKKDGERGEKKEDVREEGKGEE